MSGGLFSAPREAYTGRSGFFSVIDMAETRNCSRCCCLCRCGCNSGLVFSDYISSCFGKLPRERQTGEHHCLRYSPRGKSSPWTEGRRISAQREARQCWTPPTSGLPSALSTRHPCRCQATAPSLAGSWRAVSTAPTRAPGRQG